MLVNMNAAMQRLLGLFDVQKALHGEPATSEVRQYVSEGVVSEDGCLFLRSLLRTVEQGDLGALPDRTGKECYVNHLHFGDLSAHLTIEEQLHEAVRFAGAVGRVAPERPLRFIVACAKDECVARFHVLREGEVWICDDLESYPAEAIVVIDLPDPPQR